MAKPWATSAPTGGWRNPLVTLRAWIGSLLAALTIIGASPSHALSPKPEYRNVERIAVQCRVARGPEGAAVMDAQTLCDATAQALRDAMAPKWAGAVKVVRFGAAETRDPRTFTITVHGVVSSQECGKTLIGLSFSIYRQGLREQGPRLPPAPFVTSRTVDAPPLSEQALRNRLGDFMRATFALPLLQANPRHP